MDLSLSLAYLSGIGPIIAKRLQKLNLITVYDLIHHYPFRYNDFSKKISISEIKIGDRVTVSGEIWQIKNAYTRYGKVITKAIINDGSASLELSWFNQPYLTKTLKPGDKLHVAGVVSKFAGKLTIIAPDWEKQEHSIHTGAFVPVYPETAGVSSKWLRNKINQLLPGAISSITDFLPEDVRNGMLPLNDALQKIHFPPSLEEADKARERLGFDELFLISLATQQIRLNWQKKTLIKKWQVAKFDLQPFIDSLPFKLTAAQDKVIAAICQDLQKDLPMNRLLQGEVGSGKTVVAAAAMYISKLNGFQSLLMAPTEILAWQHFDTLQKILEPLGLTVGLYTGSRKFTKGKVERVKGKGKKLHPSSLTLNPNVIVGTHALLSDKLKAEKVGLVVIDEQHRFGVEQRTLLRQKGSAPHFLTMTATPIPRTIALTVYGDLDMSVIDELPKGRIKVKTYLVPEHKREDAYKFIAKKVKIGDQVFIITPLIDESESNLSIKAATVEYKKLKQIFSDLIIGLLHGKMKSKDKDDVVKALRAQAIDILVSTSVVEVGMDIPNATIMVIEGAQRFGLAQLHQLRGRVGRGTKPSFCLLFTDTDAPDEINRIKHLEKVYDGLKLSELDLKIRGAGTIFATSQHGRFDLKIARLTNLQLVEKARGAAAKILAEDPSLDKYVVLRAQLALVAKDVAPD